MFKTLAILGFLAGGAAFAVYHHSDMFGCKSHSCCLSTNSCGDAAVATPSPCCHSQPECCEAAEPCCHEQATRTDSCCASKASASVKTTTIAAKAALCCVDPCAACVAGCAACPICAVDCGACCGREAAKLAVGGPAGALTKATK